MLGAMAKHMLVNGCYFDPDKPDPHTFDLETVAHGLERLPRFDGQTTRIITVAEHCLRVRRFVILLGGGVEDELAALLHDAPEALVPWGDCLAPGKTDEMREVEDRVLACIHEMLRLPAPVERPVVKHADMLALYIEALLWQPGARDWADAGLEAARVRPDVGVSALLADVWPRPGEDWASETLACTNTVSLARHGRLSP